MKGLGDFLNSKYLSAVFIFICTSFYACNQPVTDSSAVGGQYLFEKNCGLCHGKDGKLMAAAAPDLSLSKLNAVDVLYFIERGSPQKGMPAYGLRLKKDELEMIRDYVLKLRTNN
jgi:mono/diheme cytochrome c family protein